MKNATCGVCGRLSPLGQSFTYRGTEHCYECIKAKADGQGIDEKELVRHVDATVCAACGKDGGDADYPAVSGLHLCPACEKALLHRPYPLWLKAGFLAAVAFVALGFFVNRRYFGAYFDMRSGFKAMETMDVEAASARLAAASRALPSRTDLKYYADYSAGLLAMSEDRCGDALASFTACKGVFPDEGQLDAFILNARIGDAFDRRDYRVMLEASRDQLEAGPADGMRMLVVASAAACLYAESGDPDWKEEAESMIAEAEAAKTADTAAEYEEYERRISHRLESRKVLSSKEYYALFPQEGEGGSR